MLKGPSVPGIKSLLQGHLAHAGVEHATPNLGVVVQAPRWTRSRLKNKIRHFLKKPPHSRLTDTDMDSEDQNQGQNTSQKAVNVPKVLTRGHTRAC